MTLSNRTGLLILPVILLGYSVAFLGVYDALKRMMIELDRSETQMQVAELSDSLQLHSMMLDQYFQTIHQQPEVRRAITDSPLSAEQRWAVEKAINAIGVPRGNRLTVAVSDHQGKVEYLVGQSNPVEANVSLDYMAWLDGLSAGGSRESSRLLRGEGARLIKIRLAERGSAATPEAGEAWRAPALIVAIDAPGFAHRVSAVVEGGKYVDWSEARGELPSNAEGSISVTEPVAGLGMLRVTTPEQWITSRLQMVGWLLGLAFVVLAAFSYIALRWLFWRYVVQPVECLERELVTAREQAPGYLEAEGPADQSGSPGEVASLQKELRKSYQIAREMAEKDGLTRLYNRRMFYYHIERLLQRSERDRINVALLYIDIDNLKLVNERHGQNCGDELLRNFADRLSEVLRPGDIVASPVARNYAARLAGDEFAVLLENYDDDEAPGRVAMRIFGICDQDYLIQSAPVASSLSIGVACFPKDAASATELLSNADSALALAKSRGGNQYAFYSRAQADKSRREADIEAAFASLPYSEFELYYMPIVRARTNRVCGVEALLRWNSDVLGRVSPDEFIPVAEAMGAFRGIDRWVINQASADLPRLKAQFGQSFHISVNISAAELVSREFVDEMSAMVHQGFIEPEHIELEITETFNADHGEGCDAILRRLRDLGFSISIDDFGTGYTAMVQLVEYPVDKIKLDKTFLSKVLKRDRVEVVGALVDFCKSQSFEVTAEGIETVDQLVTLTEAGCDYLQGYYFSPPRPLRDLLEQYRVEPASEEAVRIESGATPLRVVTA